MKNKWSVLIGLTIFIAAFIRIFGLNTVPPSLYWEEVALGYDAYSIFKTGKDHHGNPFPIVAFESFGDYKPSGYFYAIVPFIPFFGLSVWSVRLPSAIAGICIVVLIGKIAETLFSERKQKKSIALFAMVATTFSPWALQFSRGGWEVNLATCFVCAGVLFGLIGGKKVFEKQVMTSELLKVYLFSLLFFVLAAYTYHATRVIAPLLGLLIVTPMLRYWKKYFKEIVILGVTGFVLMLPIVLSIKDPKVNQRLLETSAFTTQDEITASNQLVEQFGSNIVTKIIFHRNWFYLKTFIQNFFVHFRLDYLFLTGDDNSRHSIKYFGLLFPTDLIFLAIGTSAIIKTRKPQYLFLLLWLIIGVAPAAMTKAIPHALRTLPALPVYMIVIGVGMTESIEYIKKFSFPKIWFSLLVGIFSLQLLMYWHYYTFVYPKMESNEWQYGYQQMVEHINTSKKKDEAIFITTERARPAMYYWFFSKTDPKEVQAAQSSVPKDQSEFKEFQNAKFVFHLSGAEKGIIASGPQQRESFPNAIDIATINDLRGRPVWIVYRTE